MFDPALPVAPLRPADYNPRSITPDALALLQHSIATLGFCKPIVVTTSGLLIAGHQRVKAALLLGQPTVPAWVIPRARIDVDDEAFFNQLHNGTDLDYIDKPVHLPPCADAALRSFQMEPAAGVRGDFRSAQANTRTLIARLLVTYGNWGGAVATQSGAVVSSPHYVLTCGLLGMPVRTYRIEDRHERDARRIFGHAYGQFSYEHLPRETYTQSLAQPVRLRNGGVKDGHSWLYQSYVVPHWRPSERLLDFGCGQADYLRMFQAQGRRAAGIEFFHRDGAQLDRRTVHHMIADALGQWARHGGFDHVVCDAVLNSIDSNQAESDVITCCQAMCRPGGRVYFSGRSREHVIAAVAANIDAAKRGRDRKTEFLDADGFTAKKRGKGWMFQKFHNAAQVVALLPPYNIVNVETARSAAKWFAVGTRGPDLPAAQVEAALRREFDLPWPAGTRVGRAEEAVAAWHLAQAKDATRPAQPGNPGVPVR